MPSNRLEVLITGDARQLNDTLRSVDKAVDEMIGSLSDRTAEGALALGALSAAGGLLVNGMLQGAAQMEQYRATLTAITGDAQLADEQLQRMVKFAASTPFDLPGVVQSGVQLKALGQDVDRLLPLVGNMAAAMGRSMPDAALAFGKAMSGSQDGIQVLADSFGITRQTMAEFGAETDKQGAILTRSSEQVEKLQAALIKIVQTKFGNAMEEQAKGITGAFSNLGDALGQLQTAGGAQIAPYFNELARNLTSAATAFNQLGPEIKTVVAGMVVGTTAVAGLGAAVLAIAATMLPVIAGFQVWQRSAQQVAQAHFHAAGATHAVALAAQEQALAMVAAATSEAELAVAGEALTAANVQVAESTAAVGAAQARVTASSRTLGASMLATLGPWAAVLALIAAASLAFAAYTASIEAANAEQEKLLAVQEKQTRAFHGQRDIAIATADAIKKYGQATQDAIDQVIEAAKRLGKNENDISVTLKSLLEERLRLQNEIEAAQKAGEDTTGLQKRLDFVNEEIKLQKQVRAALQGTAAEQAKSTEAKEKEKKALDGLVEAYKEADKHNKFKDDREQLKALDELLAKIGKQHAAYKELSDTRIALARKAGEEESKEAEKARRERLDQDKHALNLIVGHEADSIQRRIALLQQLVKAAYLTADERRAFEVDLAKEQEALTRAQAQAQKEQAEAAKKAAAEKKKAREDEQKAAEKLLDAQQKGNAQEISTLTERLKRGEDVLAQLEAEIAKRDELAAAIIKQKAANEAEDKSPRARRDINRAAEAEIAAQQKKSAKEVDDLRREQAKQRQAEISEEAALRAAEAKAKEDDLREQLAAGGKVGAELKRQVNERYAAEEQALRAKAEQDKIDKSAAERMAIERQLHLEVVKLKREQREETEAIEESLKRQTDEMRQQEGFTLGIVREGVQGYNSDAFDLTAGKTKGKKSADQIRAEQMKDKAAAGAQPEPEQKTMQSGYPGQEPTATDKPKAKQATDTKGESPAGNYAQTLELIAKGVSDLAAHAAVQTQQLQQIATEQKQPVKVDIRGAAAAGRALADNWKLSTNKQEGA